MVDFTQSLENVTISHQHLTHPQSVEGTAVSVASALSATITLRHGFIEAAANTNPGTFRIFGSPNANTDESWHHILDIDVFDGTPASEALTATEPVAETVLACASTTGFVAKDLIYVQDAGAAADSEWHSVDLIVANTNVTIMMGLTNQKDSSDFIFSDAQNFQVEIDCAGWSRLRVDFSHEGATGANCAVEGFINIATDLE